MSLFQITRRIEIDAGHRVTEHGSKCKNLHGHRYVIEATIGGELRESGAERGMVMDFGFLKEEMVTEIHDPCDHGLLLWVEDPLATTLAVGPGMGFHNAILKERMGHDGFLLLPEAATGKLYLMDCVPTAEELARHWFNRLSLRVGRRSEGLASLEHLDVWETPNCRARFPTYA